MPITDELIAAALQIIGLTFSDAERALMCETLQEQQQAYEQLRAIPLPNSVAPALLFAPHIYAPAIDPQYPLAADAPAPSTPPPADLEELAFAPITVLSHFIHTRQVSSLALTEMYLRRLKRYGPTLKCVVTLTEELALTQARRADAELAAGHVRGPLHGIPWGVKDLLTTRGIPTTWGAAPYREQLIDEDATVVQRLEAAGAVLVAKLSMGELARGDVWFGGMTRNPWNLEEGSSGSSAGSAAATAAGLVGFAIGTETRGSIVSPATRCGVTGLRPTFGRVSRAGAMALSWSMDKIGPLCRAVEDCALVFQAIYGPDGRDPTLVDRPFRWRPALELSQLRIGYLQSAFEQTYAQQANDQQSLAVLRALGAQLIPVRLPEVPVEALRIILLSEAAAAFDELTRSNRDELLARQVKEAWPNVFRAARLIPAVEYLQANRVRAQAARALAQVLETVDLYLAPSFDDNLSLTNYTGHPAVVAPNGLTDKGAWSSLTFTGRLYDEATLLAVAKIYQDATGFQSQHPLLG